MDKSTCSDERLSSHWIILIATNESDLQLVILCMLCLYPVPTKSLCWYLPWPSFDLALTYFGRTNHGGCLLSESGQQALLRFYVLIREQSSS